MITDLEELVRATLAEHAPVRVPSVDLAQLRRRATHRTVAGRTSAAVGVAAAGTLAVVGPWGGPAPADQLVPQTTPDASASQTIMTPPPSVTPAVELEPQPYVEVEDAVVDAALDHERDVPTTWSRGPAERSTVERALGTLMAQPWLTDPTAQPQVVWSSAGHRADSTQGPQVVVAVEQEDHWVIGLWDERSPFGVLIQRMSFGSMAGGPLDGRVVGFVVPAEEYENVRAEQHVVLVAPEGAARVVRVGPDDPPGPPASTGLDLSTGFGAYLASDWTAVEAYAADGTLIDSLPLG